MSVFLSSPWWPEIVFLCFAALVLVFMWTRLWRPDPARVMQERMRADAIVPFKRWVQSAVMIVSGDSDYAYIDRGEARHMLQQWWEVHGPGGLELTLRSLAQADRPDNAWDLLRYLVVIRLGVGAGWIDTRNAWDKTRPVVLRLQRAYTGWRPLALAYVQARRQWRGFALDGNEDDSEMRRIVDNAAFLEDQRWTSIAFDYPFCDEQQSP